MKMREKLTSLWQNLNLVAIGFTAYITKCIITGADISDAIIVLGVCGLFGFNKMIESRKVPPINQIMQKELDNVKGAINALKLDRGMKRPVGENGEKQKRYF